MKIHGLFYRSFFGAVAIASAIVSTRRAFDTAQSGISRRIIGRMKPLLIIFAFALAFAQQAAFAQDNKLITPRVSVSPQIFSISQSANLFLAVSNSNPSSTARLEPGDRFTLTFDAASGSNFALESLVLVNSSTITPAAFGVAIDSVGRRVTITYQGVSKTLGPG
ncbi:MAG: hypothetical protein AB1631_15940, partial [Acidobacteriota bacterium]